MSDDQYKERESPVLHEDIIHAILVYLRSDKRTLSRCSLTSRTWLTPCRRHLFRNITLRNETVDPKLSAFVAFLRASSDVRTYLQKLTIESDVVDSPSRLYVKLDALCAVLDTAPNLRHLDITNIYLVDGEPGRSFIPDLGPASRSLDHLAISTGFTLTEEQYVAMLSLVCACAWIGTVDLNLVMQYSPWANIPRTERAIQDAGNAHFPAIHKLNFQLPYVFSLTPLYGALGRSILSNRSLSTISFHGLRAQPEDIRARVTEFCDNVIDAARDTLRELDFHPGISVFDVTQASGIWDKPSLTQHHQLRTLTLPLESEDMPYAGEELTRMIDSHAHILQHHPPPSLECLTLKVRVPYHRDTLPYLERYVKYLSTESYRPSWHGLDHALSNLPSAPCTVFEFIGPWEGVANVAELERCLRELLPRTQEKGILGHALNSKAYHVSQWGY